MVVREEEADEIVVVSKDSSKVATKHVEEIRTKLIAVHGVNRPLFHVDLVSALHCAIANAESRQCFTPISRPVSPQLPPTKSE